MKRYRLICLGLIVGSLLGFFCLIDSERAQAASIYTVLKVNTIQPSPDSNTPVSIDSTVKVDIPELVVASGSKVAIGLPRDISIDNGQISIQVPEEGSLTSDMIRLGPITSNNTCDIELVCPDISGPGTFYINFGEMIVPHGYTGDIEVTFYAPAGSVFTSGRVIIAKVVNSQPIFISIKSIKRIGDTAGFIDSINLTETSGGTFTPGTVINFVLSSGFSWDPDSIKDSQISIIGDWGLSGTGNAGAISRDQTIFNQWYKATYPNPSTLSIALSDEFVPTTMPGRITIGHEIGEACAKVHYLGSTLPATAMVQVSSPNNPYIKEQYLKVAEFVEADTINAELSDLKVDGLTVTGFDPKTLDYTVNVPFDTTTIPTITATPSIPGASVSVFGPVDLDGSEAERTATVVVTSADGTVTQSYRILFVRSDEPQPPGESDCFIATAAFGSYLDPHVSVLRNFRDTVLVKSSFGTWFIEKYYQYSPPIAALIAGHPLLRAITRIILTPVVLFVANPMLGIWIIIVIVLFLVLHRRINWRNMVRSENGS
jgi:hypothetical protein